jgi:YidC/Oxa1 family membrane protein insertase
VKNRKQWFILAMLLIAVLLLSGCGVAREGVDVSTTPPSGLWQQLLVWPLAKTLIWLNTQLTSLGIPYHWGFTIIVFTILVKLVTFPLTLMQIRGMEAQKAMQPKIQELQKKYGKDREKIAQEQMKLYQEAGINPLSGCFPLLVQMPILIALYAALVALGPNFQNAGFFWIPDLGFPKYTQGMGWIAELFNAGDYGRLAGYLVLPILLIVSQFFMQKWMTPPPASDNPQAGMMQQMSLVMTLMFGIFTVQVPAGLTLYWVTSNLLQMLQQWLTTSPRFKVGGTPAAAVVTSSSTPVSSPINAPSGNGSNSNPGPLSKGTPPRNANNTPARNKAKRK